MRKFLVVMIACVLWPAALSAQQANYDRYLVGGTCTLRSGTGSPESVVVGRVCDVYLRSNGGAATTVYVKESGTGNTGWTAVGSSTGTVTATAGALTLNAIMLGAGGTDSKVMASLGTTTTLLHGNAAGAPTFGAASLTADVTGILPVANGGHGVGTLAAHGVIVGNGTSAVAVTGAGTAGQVLTSNGAAADPTFQAVGGTGTVTATAGALTANAVMLGAGGTDSKVLASLGTTGQVLTSNGAGTPPSFQAAAGGGLPLTGTGATVTTDTPLLDLTETWNAGGITFNGIKLTITNTASAAASKLIDLRVGAGSVWNVARTGDMTITGSSTASTVSNIAAGSVRIAQAGASSGAALLLGDQSNVGVKLVNFANPGQFTILDGAGSNAIQMEIFRTVYDEGSQGGTGIVFGGNGDRPVLSSMRPSNNSGWGTSPARLTGKGGSVAFRWNVGTGGTATGGVLNMNSTAHNGWNCSVANLTAQAANRADQRTVQTASTTTTVTIQNQTISTGAALAFTDSDIVTGQCAAY